MVQTHQAAAGSSTLKRSLDMRLVLSRLSCRAIALSAAVARTFRLQGTTELRDAVGPELTRAKNPHANKARAKSEGLCRALNLNRPPAERCQSLLPSSDAFASSPAPQSPHHLVAVRLPSIRTQPFCTLPKRCNVPNGSYQERNKPCRTAITDCFFCTK